MRYPVLSENVKCCDVLDMRRCMSSSLNLLIYVQFASYFNKFLVYNGENMNIKNFFQFETRFSMV